MTQIDFKEINQLILEKTDIVQVISNFISLTKKGNNYLGLCPFHQDINPSFTVSSVKGIYKCFSCSESGNVITFIKKHLNKNYLETLEYFSNELSLNLDLSNNKENNLRTKTEEETQILELLNVANSFFKIKVTSNLKAQEYLKTRGIFDPEIRKKFSIGYAPYDELLTYLNNSVNYSNDLILRAGLINNNLHEIFRNRITFGIKNEFNEIVGFSARSLEPEQKPKYINSPETFLFNKSKILYNIHNALVAAQNTKELILVEGFMDVIAFDKAKIENVVALMGTALTDQQVALIKQFSITLFLDNDQAGQSATVRSIKTLLKNKVKEIFVAYNSYNKDPDEILNSEGVDALRYLLSQKKSFIDFLYDYYVNLNNLRNNADFKNLKNFNSEISQYLTLMNYDQKSYFTTKFKNEFNYDLMENLNQTELMHKELNNFAQLDFEQYYENYNIDNLIKRNEQKFNDFMANNIRIKFLIYFILKPEFAKRFYELDNSSILYCKPENFANVYNEIKTKTFQYLDLDLGSENDLVFNIQKQMHRKVFELIKSYNQNFSELDLQKFYLTYTNKIMHNLQESNGKVSLTPLIKELLESYKTENKKFNITPSIKNYNNLIKELKRFKEIKL